MWTSDFVQLPCSTYGLCEKGRNLDTKTVLLVQTADDRSLGLSESVENFKQEKINRK